MSNRWFTMALVLCAGACLVAACSDDSGERRDAGKRDAGKQDAGKQDAGKQDAGEQDAVVKDSKAADVHDLDAAPVDQGPKQDLGPAIPSKWKVSAASTKQLNDVWPASATNVVAVGKGGLILKYDGSAWTPMANPDTKKNTLHGIYGGGGSLFVVGAGLDLYLYQNAWILGYDAAVNAYSFTAIWGATTGVNMFALENSAAYPLVRYRPRTSPTSTWASSYAISTSGATLHGIWGNSETEIYVVGDKGLIAACTGGGACTSASSWKTMACPTTDDLRGVWGSSGTNIFAVGDDGAILHYGGTAWTKMTVATSTYFKAVWGSAANDVYAVGHPIFKSDESIFHYDGTSWTKMPPPYTTYLEGIRGSSKSDVWAVGSTQILHYDGT